MIMTNLIDGQLADDRKAKKIISELKDRIQETFAGPPLTSDMVINAADALARSIDRDQVLSMLAAVGIKGAAADRLAGDTLRSLRADYLYQKLTRELFHPPYQPWEVSSGIYEQYRPLGVLTHIAAGNAQGLPAASVIEGLLTGNINLLKLPEGDDGLSAMVLSLLVEQEPRLAPFIYVFDLSSRDTGSIRTLLEVSNGVAVWGSDAAVSAIRQNTPPGTAVIEWGHRLSFAYITPKGETDRVLGGLAQDICTTEQLLCSAPQCVFYETADKDGLLAFARRFAGVMEALSPGYASPSIDIHSQAEITSTLLLAEMEVVLGEKAVIRDQGLGWSVLVDYESGLRPSPMYRNIWVKPILRADALSLLRQHKNHLQTVGLACAPEEYDEIASLLFQSGVTRIVPCGEMQRHYPGEPHDGASALRRYVKQVIIQKK